jgi:hypothetical protein
MPTFVRKIGIIKKVTIMSYGYKGVLALEGEEAIELENCNYTFVRQVNEKTGEIDSGVLGGTISATYLDYPKTVSGNGR